MDEETSEQKRPLAILMVGLPYAGKSTVARATGLPIVSPDAIRRAFGHRFFGPLEPMVWSVAQMMVRALFNAGHEAIVVDGCHGTDKRRSWWTDNLAPEADTAICWVVSRGVMDRERNICRSRAMGEGDTHILPVIDRMAAEFEKPAVQWGLAGTEKLTGLSLRMCNRLWAMILGEGRFCCMAPAEVTQVEC